MHVQTFTNWGLILFAVLLAAVVFVAVFALIKAVANRDGSPARYGIVALIAFFLLAGLLIVPVFTLRHSEVTLHRSEVQVASGTAWTQVDGSAPEPARVQAPMAEAPAPAGFPPIPEAPPAPPGPPQPIVAEWPWTSPPESRASGPEEYARRTDLAAPDDHDAWKREDSIAPADARPPWVEDAGGSIPLSAAAFGLRLEGRRPGREGRLVGYSGLMQSPGEALADAQRSATRHLSVLLVWKLQGASPGARWSKDVVLRALRAFEPRIAEHVAGQTLEKLEQTVTRPYGVVYRSAALVRAEPAQVDELARRLRDAVAAEWASSVDTRHQILLAAAAALGLAVVVFLLYSFVNAGTKGFFAWPLRIISIGTLLAIYAALMYVMDWFPR